MTYTIKPSEIYQQENAKSLIKGLLACEQVKIVGFRPPNVGEFYIDADIRLQQFRFDRGWKFVRLIAEKITSSEDFWE